MDAYPWDKLKLTFMSPPGAWEDGDDVKDDDTDSAYRNKHVTDVLLPEFLKEACKKGKGGTYDWKVEPPKVRGEDYFWSGLDRPRKKLAVKEGGRKYDNTYRVKALCWDSKKNLLYMGVRGHPDEYDTLPWLMSYDPAERKWSKVTKFVFPQGTEYKFLEPPRQWEILHLEHNPDTNKLYYVCQTTHPNLKDKEAHYKCFGEINMNDVDRTVVLNENNLFTLHNRGIIVRSKPYLYISEEGGSSHAVAVTESIGFGKPRGDKEHGVLNLVTRAAKFTLFRRGIPREYCTILINKSPDFTPAERDYVEAYDPYYKCRQSFGPITAVYNKESEEFIILKVRDRSIYDFEWLTTVVAVFKRAPLSPNVLIAKPQNVKVTFHHAHGFQSTPVAPIYVEARNYHLGRENFFWPRPLGEVEEPGEIYLDRVGHTSFMAYGEMKSIGLKGAYEHFRSGPVAPFEIQLEGYNPSFLIEDGFRVESALPTYWFKSPVTQPGPCRLVKNGQTCKVGKRYLETYGDMFLYKDGTKIYVAWNDFRRVT